MKLNSRNESYRYPFAATEYSKMILNNIKSKKEQRKKKGIGRKSSSDVVSGVNFVPKLVLIPIVDFECYCGETLRRAEDAV